MHKLWWPERFPNKAVASTLTHQPVWSNGVCKVLAVWIHRRRNLLKLQCGHTEHTGPSVTYCILSPEHNDSEADSDSTSDSDADEALAWVDIDLTKSVTPVDQADIERVVHAWLLQQRSTLFPAFHPPSAAGAH
jgi:hypothetical protein